MSYKSIDPIVFGWAKKHSLHLFTYYKDEEVRSIDIVSEKGKRFQIWIDQPHNTKVVVHAWNYKNMKKEWSTQTNNLELTLEEALKTVKAWIEN